MRLSRACDGQWEHRDRALIWMCLGAGLRCGEAAQLNHGLVVHADKLREGFVLDRHTTKGKRSRRVYLSQQARRFIQPWMEAHPVEREEGPFFMTQRGRMTAGSASKRIALLMEQAAIPDASSHSLRRTFAVRLRQKGVDLMVISQLLGHSSLAVTSRYLSLDPEEPLLAVRDLRV